MSANERSSPPNSPNRLEMIVPFPGIQAEKRPPDAVDELLPVHFLFLALGRGIDEAGLEGQAAVSAAAFLD
jgi:hypothetical protein